MISKRFTVSLMCIVAWVSTASLVEAQMREWSDATGRFKISAKLVEIKDNVAYLENDQGKTLKIPVDRLSKSDQEYLASAKNPFEMVGDSPFEVVPDANKPSSSSAPSSSSSGSSGNSMASIWSAPKKTDWNRASQISLVSVGSWNVPAPSPVKLQDEVKPAGLIKKPNFHEKTTGLIVNVPKRRAVLGHKVDFAVPKPLTRLALVDLALGKAVHTEQIEANMRPIALLDSGSAVLMVGDGDGGKGFETKDTLQLWSVKGRRVERSGLWVPFTGTTRKFGRDVNTGVMNAQVLSGELVLMLGSNGRLALWNLPRREPIWFVDLNGNNLDYALSPDRSLLALYSDKTVAVVEPKTGNLLGATTYESNTPAGWNRICWSPSGKYLMTSGGNAQRVISIEDGSVVHDVPSGITAMKGLAFPDDDYALINNSMLVHLPSRIKVCEYRDCGKVKTAGDTSFIAFSRGEGGLLIPSKFPHPTAADLLEQAKDDPKTFLVHPDVGVSIDVNKVSGQWRNAVRQGIEKSIVSSGYKLDPSSPIKIVGEITGPKQDAVSYFGAGSHVVQRYSSSLTIQWNGKTLWRTGGSNIPGFMMLKRDETIESVLAKAGQSPNTSMYGTAKFPKFIQRPSEGSNKPGSNALLVSRFTLKGLVDSQ
ncbi:MAG: hypothetical protein Aurels2KO_19270 [Aureliella sp.]